jgi:hypothetical protein
MDVHILTEDTSDNTKELEHVSDQFHMYLSNILLGDFSAKVVRHIFKRK